MTPIGTGTVFEMLSGANAGAENTIRSSAYKGGIALPMTFYTGGAERVRIGTAGQLGIGGANYGTAGQVLMSGGPGAAPSWATSTIQAGSIVDTDLTLSANSAPVKVALNATGGAPIYACRAWVNFNGTGAVAIRASGNVSSITDKGTGDFTINFLTAMPDANYVVTGCSESQVATRIGFIGKKPSSSITASSVQILTGDSGNSLIDPLYVYVAIFR